MYSREVQLRPAPLHELPLHMRVHDSPVASHVTRAEFPVPMTTEVPGSALRSGHPNAAKTKNTSCQFRTKEICVLRKLAFCF